MYRLIDRSSLKTGLAVLALTITAGCAAPGGTYSDSSPYYGSGYSNYPGYDPDYGRDYDRGYYRREALEDAYEREREARQRAERREREARRDAEEWRREADERAERQRREERKEARWKQIPKSDEKQKIPRKIEVQQPQEVQEVGRAIRALSK